MWTRQGENLVEGWPPLYQAPDWEVPALLVAATGCWPLSENTGAHQELGAFAVTLHPFDIQQQADALYAALTMDPGLRRARRQAAALVVQENDPGKWLTAQLADLPIRTQPSR